MRSLIVILGCLLVILSMNAHGQMMDDYVTTDEDKTITFDVTANDAVVLPQKNTVDLNTSVAGRQTSITTPEGKYTVNNNGEVTFDPEANFFGTSSIDYAMNFGLFGFSVGTATIFVTVNPGNDKPVTENDEAVTDEDVAVIIKVLSNDHDPDNDIDPTSIEINDAEGGTFVADANGEVTFTPFPEFSGTAKAKYRVRDLAGGQSNRSEIKVRVNVVNDPPVAVDDNAVTDAGVSINIKILANDYDIDGSIDPSSVSITGESGGTFIVNNKGEVKFTPLPGFSVATANYTVQDDKGLGSKFATITVTINSVNNPPVATADKAIIDEDASPLSIDVLANDVDPDGTLDRTSIVVTNPVNGTFVATASGFVTYTPPPNFNGVATANYTVKDNNGAISNVATITVTVNEVNDNPSFDLIADQRVLKNAGNKTISITGITAGPLENETLTLKATSGSPNIVPNPLITYTSPAATATLTFKPQPNQYGTATIIVVLTDQGGKTFTRQFDINVINVEFTSEPIIIAQTGVLYQYDIEITPVSETLTIVATQKPAWTALTSTGTNKARLSGTPKATDPIINPVTLQLKDGATVLDQQQFNITINRPPAVTPFGFEMDEDTQHAFTSEDFESKFSDPDGQALAEVMFTAIPRHGTLKLGSTLLTAGAKVPITSIGNVTYNPEANYAGQDTIYWKGSDGYTFSQTAADIHIVVSPDNDAPVITFIEAEHLQYELGSESFLKITKGITITDEDNTTLTGAEIRFNFATYEQGKETLNFKDTLNISGDFKANAGVLLLTGSSSVANYQAALRTIKYKYANLAQVNLRPVEIFFTVTDGTKNSDQKSRAIDLIYTFKDLDIPSAFSPNGDRANEIWLITSPNTTDGAVPYTDALVRVYNKRGLLVYEAKGFEKPWDGTFQGKELPVDTYYYTIDLKYNRVRYKGVVTILR